MCAGEGGSDSNGAANGAANGDDGDDVITHKCDEVNI